MLADPTVETPQVDLADVYRRSRERLSDLAVSIDRADDVAVSCCPGWSVKDVVAHLAAVAEDVMAGRLTGPPSPSASAEQVSRRSAEPVEAVVADWAQLAGPFEELLTRVAIWPAVLDVLSHEHDVRAALGRPGFRDTEDVVASAHTLLSSLKAEGLAEVDCAGAVFRADGASADGALTLSTDPFEVLRFRLGRRSMRQMADMRWTGDPKPVLGSLTIFGPSETDIAE